MTWRSHGVCAVLAAAAVTAGARPAAACRLLPTVLHHTDPALGEVDTQAPTRPSVLVASASRRSGLTCGESRCVTNSCGDLGMLSVELSPTEDDQTPPDQIGYRLEVVNGFVPESLRDRIGVGFAALAPLFLDLGFEDVPSLNATLQVVAIDAAGNESEPSEPFVVSFEGCTLAAVGDQCEDDFDPDTSSGVPGPAMEAEVFETARAGAGGCSLSLAPRAQSFGAGLLTLLGLYMARLRRRIASR